MMRCQVSALEEAWDWLVTNVFTMSVYNFFMFIFLIGSFAFVIGVSAASFSKKRSSGSTAAVGGALGVLLVAVTWYDVYHLILGGLLIPYLILAAISVPVGLKLGKAGVFMAGILFLLFSLWFSLDPIFWAFAESW